jgi:hypothetical protein
MRVVTTVHKAGFDVYGHRWLESMPNWPDAEFVMYAEGFKTDAVRCVDVDDVPRLKAFKAQHVAFKPPSWRYDIVRFSNKVFAAYDALYDYDGIGVWLDADCVTYNPIPAGYIEEQLGDAYLAHFRREGHYTETGMWLMNCAHPKHKGFMDRWLEWFESGAFKHLAEWHDCTTLDKTIKITGAPTRSLSGAYEGVMHPMAKADIARFVDHCKGGRKALGISPENKLRSA